MATELPIELQLAMKQLNKKFGREVVALGPHRQRVESFSSGSITLDHLVGNGGLPIGRIVEIYGLESTGKTSLAIFLMKKYIEHMEARGTPRYGAFVDLERSSTGDFLASFGIDLDTLVWAPVDTAEEALDTAETLAATGSVGFIVVDSVAAIETDAQFRASSGESKVGGPSKLMSESLRKLVKSCDKNNVTIVFINQVRDKMGTYMGGLTTPGGHALPFYSALRIHMHKREASDFSNCFKLQLHIEKNKFTLADKTKKILIEFMNGVGVMESADIIEALKESGVASFAGPSFRVQWSGEKTSTTVASGGKLGAIEQIENDPNLKSRLRDYALEVLDLKS